MFTVAAMGIGAAIVWWLIIVVITRGQAGMKRRKGVNETAHQTGLQSDHQRDA